MPPGIVTENDAGSLVTVYVRLRGLISDEWEEGSPPSTAQWVDRYIEKLPFGIGRTVSADPDTGLSDDPSSWWLFPNQPKISRKHAIIRWNEATQQFCIKCYGSNGADVNGIHLASGEECALSSKSTLRIGPLYAYFLLPKISSPSFPVAPHLAPKAKTKLAVPGGYAAVIDSCVSRHFAAFENYFTLLDLAKLAQEDFPGQGLQEDAAALRNQLSRVLTKSPEYDFVPTASVPRYIIDQFEKVHAGAQKGQIKWFVKLDSAGVEKKKQRLAKEDTMEVG